MQNINIVAKIRPQSDPHDISGVLYLIYDRINIKRTIL